MMIKGNFAIVMTISSVTIKSMICCGNQPESSSTQEKSKHFIDNFHFYENFNRVPVPIDIDNVPKHLENEIGSYENYLKDLGNYAYFMMGNGPV